MRKAEAIQQFRDYMIRFMGLLVAPLIFTCITCGIALLVINTFAGDLIGYGSLLLMDSAQPNYEVSDFLAPAEPGKRMNYIVDIIHKQKV